jgi:hypothetical protein
MLASAGAGEGCERNEETARLAGLLAFDLVQLDAASGP